ncbi:MAG: hypothetical protein RL037_2285, partial [Bacteroidota bacterium]
MKRTKQIILTLFIGLLLFGCNSTTKTENNTTSPDSTIENQSDNSFYFDEFNISKSQLGNIKIGMTIEDAERQFAGLSRKVDVATKFGLGGGSRAYLYYSGDELIFGLIPKLST